ncbi:hypothetical protein AYI69_g9543 [Smittium culicis]|uniref:Uncharacterized protein n=1 Tax=Smittium culicis TaxID=133412 RepID=A0A1R1XBZ5_9FUNG|nr:hypothetical protein AYI69_g9543 [Smittium culicis]
MSWIQFKDQGHCAVKAMVTVSKHLVGTYYSIQEDFRNIVTYYIFHKVSDAEKLIKNFICRQGIKIEFYQTVKFEEDITIINIPNFKDVDIITMIDIIESQLENCGEIKDISALARKGTGEFLPYGMKIFFAKKSVDTYLPSFFVHDGGKINLFYRGKKKKFNISKKVKQKIKPYETVAKLTESIMGGKIDTDKTPIENTRKPIRSVDFGTDFGLPMSSVDKGLALSKFPLTGILTSQLLPIALITQ